MREIKDSGIEWIGAIPVNWKTVNLKYLCDLKTGGTPNNKLGINNDCNGYPWITPQDIDASLHISKLSQFINDEAVFLSGYTLFPPNSVLLVCIASVGKVGIIREKCYSNQQITALKCKAKVMADYLLYFISSASSKLAFDASSNVVPIINSTYLSRFTCLLPDSEEQKRIILFLDKECAELDSLVIDIQSQIEALEEYKRSVITEAVTKGLDPDVEMRESGVQWVGDVPKHWIQHPLYCYFGERKNKNALGLETNLLSLSYGKIIRKDINSNGGLLPESFNTYNIVEKEDIIIRPTDLQNDKRSLRTGICREHGIITSAYIAMKAIKSVNPEYFHYLLHAYDVMKVFYNMGNGVRQGLNFSEFSRLMVFEPTIEEQNAIVVYLKEKCDEIDLAIAEKKQQIDSIEEYKKSLIFEYVTGKKEVNI